MNLVSRAPRNAALQFRREVVGKIHEAYVPDTQISISRLTSILLHLSSWSLPLSTASVNSFVHILTLAKNPRMKIGEGSKFGISILTAPYLQALQRALSLQVAGMCSNLEYNSPIFLYITCGSAHPNLCRWSLPFVKPSSKYPSLHVPSFSWGTLTDATWKKNGGKGS